MILKAQISQIQTVGTWTVIYGTRW